MTAKEEWEEVLTRFFQEHDPEKRKSLVAELHLALDERARRIRSTWLHQNGSGRRERVCASQKNAA